MDIQRVYLSHILFDLVLFFLIPKMWHLSGLINISAQLHHRLNKFTSNWFSRSRDVVAATSSANWDQFIGPNPSNTLAPNVWYFSCFNDWIKVLIIMLNKRGLKQSPCSTPFVTLMKRVLKSFVRIGMWKTSYKLPMLSGLWWYFRTVCMRLWLTDPKVWSVGRSV